MRSSWCDAEGIGADGGGPALVRGRAVAGWGMEVWRSRKMIAQEGTRRVDRFRAECFVDGKMFTELLIMK